MPAPRGVYQFPGEAFAAPDPLAWCRGEAGRLLGPKAHRKEVGRLGDCLAGYLDIFRPHMPLIAAGLFFQPGFRKLPAGVTIRVEAVDVSRVHGGRQFTMADVEEAAAEARGASRAAGEVPFGRTEAAVHELPAGPALRVHRYVKGEGRHPGTAAGEVIVWTIWPPGPPVGVIVTSMWLQPYFANVAAEIADAMARGFGVKPWDAE